MYHRLNADAKRAMESNALGLTRWELQQGAKLTAMLSLRVKELRTGRDLGIGDEACKEIQGFMRAFLLDVDAEFPFDVAPEAVGEASVASQLQNLTVASRSAAGEAPGERESGFGPTEEEGRSAAAGASSSERPRGPTAREGGSLMPPVRLYHRGDKALLFDVVKFGLKDATSYIDPFVTVSVVNGSGILKEATQDTPVTNRREPQHVMFGDTVHVQTPLKDLGDDATVVLEFKHYKPKKKKISTRCWAFFTLGEVDLRSGATQRLALELYSKPTDLKCKKLSLHTKKELYAHLDVIVQTE